MKKDTYGFVYLLITIIIFSTYEVVSKTIVGRVDPFQINFIRFLIGGLILFVFLLFKRDIYISRKDLLSVALLGVISVAISMNLMQLSLSVEGATASTAAVIFSSNPIFVTFFSALIEKEKIKLSRIIGLSVGILGIFTVFADKLQINLSNIVSPLLTLAAAITFALYTVIGRKASTKIGSLKMNTYSFIMGSIILVPFLILFKIPIIKFDYSAIPQVMYLSIFVTGIAYFTYFMGLSTVGASKGSLVFFVKPVMASIIAIIFLNEKVSMNLIIGMLLTIAGIFIVLYYDKFKQKNPGVKP